MPYSGNDVINKARVRYGDMSQAAAIGLLNEVSTEIFMMHPIRQTISVNVAASTPEYAFGGAYAKAWAVRYVNSPADGDYYDLFPTSTDGLDDDFPGWRNADPGTPQQYYITTDAALASSETGAIGFYPSPDTTTIKWWKLTVTPGAGYGVVGATFTNGGNTYTVVTSMAVGGSSIVVSGAITPSAGAFTYVAGGGASFTCTVVTASGSYPIVQVDVSIIPAFSVGTEPLPDIPFVLDALADLMCFKRAKDSHPEDAAMWMALSDKSLERFSAIYWERNPRVPQTITPAVRQAKGWNGNRPQRGLSVQQWSNQ